MNTCHLLRDVGLFTAVALSHLLLFTLLIVHGNGGRVTIDMTTYGERYIEVVLAIVLLPIQTLALHYYTEDY